jgi:Ca-activated chloride channel homolog
MRLRNSRVLIVLSCILFFTLTVQPQQQGTTPAPPPPQAQQPTAQQPATPPPAGQDSSIQPQGETPSSDDSGLFTFRKEVEEVILHVTVVDKDRRMITSLGRDNFQVFENNQPQRITSFRHEDIPVALGIVVDNSGSMREKRERVAKAALNLVRASNPGDQVFIVNFNDEYFLDQDFTNSIPKLKEALDKLEAKGGTALYDAIVAASDYLKKNATLQKKVLVVVTDGEDDASRQTLEQAVSRLQEENGPTVYGIAILGEEKQRRARRVMETIAERTGGIAFLPKGVDQVDEISSTVARDIRNQYTIGYKPTTPKSVGGYRTIHVEAKAKGFNKLTARTRSGYYAGQEKGPGGAQ